MPNLTQLDPNAPPSGDDQAGLELLDTSDLASGKLWRPADALRNRRAASGSNTDAPARLAAAG
jgi:hypothetical protein